MRKDSACNGGGSTTTTTSSAAQISLYPSCVETKRFFALCFLVSLVMVLWQLQPYESSLFAASNRRCIQPSRALLNPSEAQKVSSLPSPAVEKPAPSDPNKRSFKSYGSAAALFVQMGAYRGGPNTFAVVGLSSKPLHVYAKPFYKCEWIPNSNSSRPIKAKAYKMLPDWGYGHVYTVVIVNCTFSEKPNVDNAGGRLVIYAYYGDMRKNYERFVAMEEKPGEYDEGRYSAPHKYDYLYCGSSLYGDLNANRIREWMAYHALFFGPRSHFVFHDAGGVSPAVRVALEPWVQAGRATVQDIRDQGMYDGYYYNQFMVVNDCLHRYKHAANWTFFFDVDEYLHVMEGNTLESVLEEFKDYTQFTIEQNTMSSSMCVQDPNNDHSSEWGFEKLVFQQTTRPPGHKDRKYAIQAKNAYATGVHMSQNVIGKTLHQTESKIRYYHYHNSINVMGEPCRDFFPIPKNGMEIRHNNISYIYDDTMKRKAGTVKAFEERMIRSVHT
ncbi:hypothetical protein QJS04_geneDACA001435 [Acorus gramineus]|uniref:Glycosyltransferase family 92 protein n=1 Tax=Acorus gramineus TaxID=55184 RepID=A0AAV9A762_ACOGR|nr:hypothetical protein QJS04_geneDACA001435 [Acorus gramineus]